MTPVREAVAAWNARYKANDPPEECPRCQQPRMLKVEASGRLTMGECACCGFWWVIV